MAKPDFETAFTKQKLVSAQISKGMISAIDPADIPEDAVQDAKNCYSRFGKLSRRNGLSVITPTKPNSNKILDVFNFKKFDGTSYIIRATKNSLHYRTGAWNNIPAVGGATLSGSDTDRFQFVVINNQLIQVNNGIDAIHLIDPTVGYSNLIAVNPNNYKYKYATGFFNRGVFASLSSNPVRVAWTGDGVFTIIDPALDKTAGFSDLVESSEDEADFITGIFGLNNYLVIPREHSIWLATKQPIPTLPFNFFNALPGIGCDTPYSMAVVPGGLVWADTRTGKVYFYAINGDYNTLSDVVEDRLFTGVTDTSQIFGSYDSFNNEYSLCIPIASSNYIRQWIFNFRTKSWVYNEIAGLSHVTTVDFASGGIAIDDLTGTIDDLVGTIDSLGSVTSPVATRLYGNTSGDILKDDLNVDKDNGVAFESSIVSKEFTAPEIDLYFAEIRIEYLAHISGTVDLYFTKNSGADWRLLKTFNVNQTGKRLFWKYSKHIKCRRLAFKIVATSGRFDTIGYEINVFPSGKSVK